MGPIWSEIQFTLEGGSKILFHLILTAGVNKPTPHLKSETSRNAKK